MELVWTEQLSVGNAVLDSDHKKLVGMVNNMGNAIRAGGSFVLSGALVHLEVWLRIHFAKEERIAQAIDLDFSDHKRALQFSLDELRLMRDVLIARNVMQPDRAAKCFIHFLKNWSIDGHIIDLNMPMKQALQANDYEFWPSRCGGKTG